MVKHDRGDKQAQVWTARAQSVVRWSLWGGRKFSSDLSILNKRKISSTTRTPGAGQWKESPPPWRCQITIQQPGRPHSEKSSFESRWVESEAWPSSDLKQFVRKLLHQGANAPSRKEASTHKDLIRLAAVPELASEEGLKRVNKPARPRASCWENLPPRLHPCWDDGVRLSALRWEEPRVILTGLPPASTEAAAFWTREHGSLLATSHLTKSLTEAGLLPSHRDVKHSLREGREEDSGTKKAGWGTSRYHHQGGLSAGPGEATKAWLDGTVLSLPGLAIDYPQKSTLFQKNKILSPLFTVS